MSKIQNIVIGILALGLVLTVGMLLGGGGKIVTNTIEKQLGSGIDPNISSPYICVNGACHFPVKVEFKSPLNGSVGTTTVCSIPLPSNSDSAAAYSASTTIVYFGATFNSIGTSTTAHAQLYLGTNGPTATSGATNLGGYTLTATGTLAIATTSTITTPTAVGKANSYLILEVNGANGGPFLGIDGKTGTCSAQFRAY